MHFANFQSWGTSPVFKDLINKSATNSEITDNNSINILDPTKSIPGDLFIFNLLSFDFECTNSGVIKTSEFLTVHIK